MSKVVPVLKGVIVGFMVGFIFGVVKEYDAHIKKNSVGTIRVDKSEPELPPKLFLELETDLNTIVKSKYVKLKVLNENYISQK